MHPFKKSFFLYYLFSSYPYFQHKQVFLAFLGSTIPWILDESRAHQSFGKAEWGGGVVQGNVCLISASLKKFLITYLREIYHSSSQRPGKKEERKETSNFSKKKDNVWINKAHWSPRLIHAVLMHIGLMVWLGPLKDGFRLMLSRWSRGWSLGGSWPGPQPWPQTLQLHLSTHFQGRCALHREMTALAHGVPVRSPQLV